MDKLTWACHSLTQQHMLEQIRREERETVIVTPEVFLELDYHLPGEHQDVIFIGFDCSDPLKIPKDLKVYGDVYIVSSVLAEVPDLKDMCDFILIDVSLDELKSFPRARGIVKMDEETFDSYRSLRTKRNYLPNLVLRKSGIQEMLDELSKKIDEVGLIDILVYLDATGQDVEYIKTDSGIKIEGNIILAGPIHFDMSDVHIVDGDLFIHNEIKQNLDDVTVLKDIDATGYI